MIIEVKKQIALRKYVGDFAYECPPPEGKTVLPLCEVEGNIKVSGSYEIYEDDSVGVTLKIAYALKGQCSYCLEDARSEISFSYDALFVTDKDDADNYYYDGTRLDVQPAAEDAFVFSQPKVLLCEKCSASSD